MRFHAALGAACVAVIAGCAAVDATPSVTATAAASLPASEEDVAELEFSGDPLPAGRYTHATFEPRITLELEGGWAAVQNITGFFDVERDVGSPHVIAVQFARPLGVYGEQDAVEPTSAANAVELLGENPNLEIIERSPSRIGGLEGSQVTVENVAEPHTHVLHLGAGGLGIDQGRRLWIAFFDTEDGLLAVMVGGSAERWDEALAAAEPVLESILIGG